MRTLLALLLAGVSVPAFGQHSAHSGAPPVQPSPAATCTAEHAAMGHCKMPAAPPPAPASTCTAEHAAMGHCTLPAPPKAAPAAPACTAEHAAMGHCKLAQEPEVDSHASHEAASPAPPVAPPPPEALSGPAHAADLVFGGAAMAEARRDLVNEHGNMRFSKLLVDRLEARHDKGRDTYLLDAEAWYGGDLNKAWLKTEIEGERGRKPGHAEVQALWSRAIDPWFDLQAGVRFDANKGPDRAHLVLGVQGLAPYWWEVDGAFFLSSKGEVTARAEAEYDLRITQKLILQPRVEVELSAQDIEELGIGAGLSTADFGLRLRYQVSQQFSPYIGVSYERAFGDTLKFRRDEGERAGVLGLLAGLRMWF